MAFSTTTPAYTLFLGLALVSCTRSIPGIRTHYPVDPSRQGYVDFHNHITMKPFVTKVEIPATTPEQAAAAALLQAARQSPDTLAWSMRNTPGELRFKKEGDFSDFSGYRQSNWGALGTYRLVCTSLYAYERGLVDDKHWGNRVFKKAASNFGISMPKPHARLVQNKYLTAFDELQAEYAFTQRQARTDPQHPEQGPKIVLVTAAKDIQQLQPGQTGVVFSIEGGHALFGNGPRLENRLLLHNTTLADAEGLRQNIATLKRWEHPVLFVTLSHLIWNKLAGHGKGTDIEGGLGVVLHSLFGSRKVRAGANAMPATGTTGISGFSQDDPLPLAVPYDNGLTGSIYNDPRGLGKLVIDSLLSRHGGRRILLDMRHSGLKTRLEYYALVAQRRVAGDTIPIMVSHAAMSGKSLRFALATALRPLADDYAEFKNPAKYYKELEEWYADETGTRLDSNSQRVNPGWMRVPWKFERSPFLRIARAGFIIDGKPHYYRDFFKHQPNRQDTLSYLRVAEIPTIGQRRAGFFQPSSINLADDEIDIICRSGGIIGLTVEQRGLGTRLPQAQAQADSVHQALRARLASERVPLPKGVDQNGFINRFLAAAPFVRNLAHLVRSASPQSDVWRHIAIGTDFDGIVNPIDYFHTSDRLPELEQFVFDHFDLYDELYRFGLGAALANTPSGRPYSKQQALRQLFSENGTAFITKHYPVR
ncbi:membrane dipeptidase [Hymenobacter arizonensis]|uniref:Membrane dipeptidase (Peptidase family M19) n=1 Tax=Hymenobacter arizonensis TaxID=1227077 RepID=A0A1I5YYN9_HYMAR|nr:membrane dipeptidase [Hymenobacter arizonensis]SFQ49351.1 Membrane dipeptidase (Peptidase family M19) [Hymenobacter arizonensis]